MPTAVNLAGKLAAFSKHWSPKIVAQFNGHDVMVVKVNGEFVWHKHDDTDDFFLVLSGRLTIRLRDGDVVLTPGDLFVVPVGVEHQPYADEETHLLLIEPSGTPNTGDQKTALRASGGIFYNFLNQGQYLYNEGPLVSRVRSILNATLDDIDDVTASGNLVDSPQQANLPAGFDLALHGNQMPQAKLQPEKNYQVNVAVQRDIGFKTVAEVAWVGNYGRNFWRAKTMNNIEPFAYGRAVVTNRRRDGRRDIGRGVDS